MAVKEEVDEKRRRQIVSDRREEMMSEMHRRPLQTISYRFMVLQFVRYAIKQFATFTSWTERGYATELRRIEQGVWVEFMLALSEESFEKEKEIRYIYIYI